MVFSFCCNIWRAMPAMHRVYAFILIAAALILHSLLHGHTSKHVPHRPAAVPTLCCTRAAFRPPEAPKQALGCLTILIRPSGQVQGICHITCFLNCAVVYSTVCPVRTDPPNLRNAIISIQRSSSSSCSGRRDVVQA